MKSRLSISISVGKLHLIKCGHVADDGSRVMTISRSILSPHRHHWRRSTGTATNVHTTTNNKNKCDINDNLAAVKA